MRSLNQGQLVLVLTVMLATLLNAGCAATAVGAGAAGVSAAVDRRTAGTLIDDEIIEVKGLTALGEDTELWDQAHLSVTSYNGIVLLSGEAPSAEMKQRAADIVRRIEKVRHVYNEVAIAAPSSVLSRSNDTYLSAKVKSALLSAPDVTANHVKVVTEAGTVFLMGILSRTEANTATEVTRRVGGVQRVVKLFEYRS
ncbi:MAG: BON domain-containing protein [Pseudomonadota bacterium]